MIPRQNLERLMELRGIQTQKDLSDLSGLPQSKVSAILSGRSATTTTARYLCLALRVPLSLLICNIDHLSDEEIEESAERLRQLYEKYELCPSEIVAAHRGEHCPKKLHQHSWFTRNVGMIPADNLLHLMIVRGIQTQKELAKTANITQSNITNILKGHAVKLDAARRLCLALRIPLSMIVAYIEHMGPEVVDECCEDFYHVFEEFELVPQEIINAHRQIIPVDQVIDRAWLRGENQVQVAEFGVY